MLLLGKTKFDFHRLVLEQAVKTLESLSALADSVREPGSAGKNARVAELRSEAGGLRRTLLGALDRGESAPLDREDLFSLSRAIDEMAARAQRTVEEMALFEVPTDDFLNKTAAAVHAAGREIVDAWRSLDSDPRASQESIVRAKKLENQAESVCREALADLYESPNTVVLLKTRELYKHLSEAAEHGSKAADIIGDILVKSI